MAAAAATDTKKIEQEAGKLTKLRIVSDQNEENLKKAEKLNRKFMRALEESQSQPNVTQIATAVVGAGAGAVAGNAIQRRLRKMVDEKLWVNAKGERSIANIIVADVMVPVFGTAIMIGGAYIDNGPMSAGAMGIGGGLAAGSAIGSINAPSAVVVQLKV